MKFLLLLFLSFLYITTDAQINPNSDTTTVTQIVSQPKTILETISAGEVSVTYARPHRTGYRVFGNLRKYGKVWAVGAPGKTSTITFSGNINFAGVNVEAGTYTLFVIPYENQWTVILNSQAGHPGASAYEKYKDKNIATVNVPVVPLLVPIDQLTIRFPLLSSMIIEWDNTQVVVPII